MTESKSPARKASYSAIKERKERRADSPSGILNPQFLADFIFLLSLSSSLPAACSSNKLCSALPGRGRPRGRDEREAIGGPGPPLPRRAPGQHVPSAPGFGKHVPADAERGYGLKSREILKARAFSSLSRPCTCSRRRRPRKGAGSEAPESDLTRRERRDGVWVHLSPLRQSCGDWASLGGSGIGLDRAPTMG